MIHTPPDQLPAVFASPSDCSLRGAHVLLAIQVGDACVHLNRAYGHAISLDAHRLPPNLVAELLDRSGFTVDASLTRQPIAPEKVPQAYLLAHKRCAEVEGRPPGIGGCK
jgi:hypothetical protein